MTDKPTVALLGTGTMGAGMARNIASACMPLHVWNRSRTKAEPLADAGAPVASTPAEALRGASIVVTMLFGTRKPAEEGALVVLASGAEDIRQALAPLFDAIASRTTWVGAAGAGARLKL